MSKIMKKRNVLTLLCSLCISFLLFSTTVSAATVPVFSVVSVEGEPGKTATVYLNLENSNSGFVSANLIIEYDSNVLSLREVKDTKLLYGAMHTTAYVSPYYLTWVNDEASTNYTASGTLAALVFEIDDSAAAGEYEISVSVPRDGVLDKNGEEVTCSFVSGKIIVPEIECSHLWGEWFRTNSSKHKRTCGLCGEAEYERHDWDSGIITIEPTPGEVGVKVYTCEICGGTKSEVLDAIPKEECTHVWNDWIGAGSFEHKHTCKICRTVTYEDHEWDAGIATVQPTPGKDGEIVYTCRVCGAQRNEIIPALGVEKYTLYGTVTSYGDDETVVTNLQLYSGSGISIAADPSYTTVVAGTGVKDYSFSDIPAGTYTLRVSKAGHLTEDYIITIDNDDINLDVEINLEETATVTLSAEVTQFSSDSASVSIRATSSSEFFGKFFVASYDENGKMLDVKVYPAAEEVLAQVDNVGSSVKVFWVDNQTSFTPVCPTVPLSTETIPDNLYYDVYDTYVEITKYAGTATDLTIPKTIEGIPVTKIGMYAFDGCTSLKTLTLQSGITEIDAFAFNDCTSLETIVLPDGLKTIGDLAFQSCRKITAITIPDGVTTLGWNIFNNCLALKETHIPTSVVTVHGKTIVWNQAGTGITVAGDISSYFFSCWTELETVVVADGCTFIGEGAFRDCTSLTSIVLPESITTMESRVFAECKSLRSIIVPSKVTELGDFVFSGCRSMTSIILPNSLEVIGRYVFQSCDSLVEVEIPAGVTIVGDGAFNVCGNLKKVVIPDSVTSISDTAFNYCTNLTVYCAKGSYADTYAQNKNISVQYV